MRKYDFISALAKETAAEVAKNREEFMADNNTEKQRVQELTDKLEQGLQDLFNSDSYRNYLSTS